MALLQEQLRQPENKDKGMGFGMFYVAERISLCYGKDYGVTIDSVEGEGTSVIMRVPLTKKEEEHDV